MKSLLFIFLSMSICLLSNAQVGVGTTNPSSAAVLHLEALNPTTSNYGGFLMPIVTEAQQGAIPVSTIDSSDDGLMVYVSDPITGKRCWDIYDGEEHIWRSITCNNRTCTGNILYQENFDSYSNGTGVSGASSSEGDYPVANWTLTSFQSFGSMTTDLPGLLLDGNDYAQVNGGELEFRDTNGVIRFQTAEFDISGFNDIQITADIRATGDFEYVLADHTDDFNCGETESDYLDISYSLDGGISFIEITNYATLGTAHHTVVFDDTTIGLGSDGSLFTLTESGINGNTMILRIQAQNWADDERIFVDNILVSCN